MTKSKKKLPAKKIAKPIKKSAKKVAKKISKKPTKKNPKKKREDLNCFLTTACVRYYGLSDNGYELNTLRNFRDTYLASRKNGSRLIKEYYAIAPKIVNQIELDADKKSVYAYIYQQVLTACAQIEKQDLLQAKKTYVSLVEKLKSHYKKIKQISNTI